ncbi:MAG: DnaA regulatory inactivator Hda [Burkholderiales bacterium]|nr:DnaA regulatory inactivator Hda [Burkholderiales bacterium]MDE2454991.1 DnaA regulatory inactivator Hda [Burkholderiales bacterium]
MKQIPLAIGFDPLPTFESFLPGANGAALEHLRRLAMPAAPVYLWGPSGSGKTHLLHALAHACQQAGQRVGWFSAGDLTPWPLAPDWSLVILDRCDEFDEAAQQAAFALFVEAATEGVQLAAAGRLPPVDLALRDDLRTRLGWGHVFAMQPLSEAETRAALRREGDRRGILLSDDVMDHLLTRFPRDLKHLMNLLDRLDEYALSRARTVTVPLVRSMLVEEGVRP